MVTLMVVMVKALIMLVMDGDRDINGGDGVINDGIWDGYGIGGDTNGDYGDGDGDWHDRSW